jgi:hypothetical protein
VNAPVGADTVSQNLGDGEGDKLSELIDFSMVRREGVVSINGMRWATIEVSMPVAQGIHR